MNLLIRASLLAGLVMARGSALAQSPAAPAPPGAAGGDAQPATDKVSYSVGYDLGVETAKGLKSDGVAVDPELVAKGLADGLRGQASTLTAEQVDATLVALHKALAEKRVKARIESDPVFKALADDNAKRCKQFHDNYAKKTGVITLPSGCQYLVLTKGEGQPVADSTKVQVNFRALTINNVEYGRGEGVEIAVSTVNEGAQELLRMMREGDKWQAAIPPERAFGLIGKEPNIGPNESLIAEVEIVRAIK